MAYRLDRRSLLKNLGCATIAAGAHGAFASLPAAAQTPAATPARPGIPRRFTRATLANGIIIHAGETSMELYHRHPHDPKEEIVQPEDIRLQTRLTMRNHKEVLDWMGLDWRHVVQLTRYQKRMDETAQIDAVLRSYFKEGLPPQTIYEIQGLSSPQARLEIDMWVLPPAGTPQPGTGGIKGIDPIFPRPEVTDRMAYAPGIRLPRDMDLIFFSGTSAVPYDVDPWNPGSFKVPADAAERATLATENLQRVLTAAGITWPHLIMNVNYTAPGGGPINFREHWGNYSPCSTSLRVDNTGVPGINALYNLTAAAPHKAATAIPGAVRGIEPILPGGAALKDLPQAPAVRVSTDLDLLFFSGITAYPLDVDPYTASSSHSLSADVAAQERAIEANIDRALKDAGLGWNNIVHMTRVGEVGGVNAYREKFGDWRPARFTRAVGTGVPGAKVMVEIIAAAPRR